MSDKYANKALPFGMSAEVAEANSRTNLIHFWTSSRLPVHSIDSDEVDVFDELDFSDQHDVEARSARIGLAEMDLREAPCGTCPNEDCQGTTGLCLLLRSNYLFDEQ